MLLKVFTIIVSLTSWVLTYFAYSHYKKEIHLPDAWYIHLLVLLGIGLLCIFITFFIKDKSSAIIPFIIRVLLFFLICFPAGDLIIIPIIMITGIIAEAVFYFKLKMSILLSTATFIAAFFIAKNTHLVWNNYTTPANWQHLLIFFMYVFSVFYTFCMIKNCTEREQASIKEVERLNIMISVLVETNKKYQDNAIDSAERSKAEERKRIASDLHDIIGFSMTNIKMMVEAALTMIPKKYDELTKLFQEIKTQTSEGFDEMIYTVRTMYRTPQNKRNGMSMVHGLVKSFVQATRINVKLDFTNMPNSCGEVLDNIIYHIVQEGIINSFKHGHADNISISFWKDKDSVKIHIWDNGKGSVKNVKSQGIGLEGIKDRVISVGGSFNSCNVINGYEVSAVLPYHEGDNNEYQNIAG